MLLALSLLLGIQTVVGPDSPSGTNQAFQRASLAIQELLHKGDFAAAERRLAKMPKLDVVLEWDDANVPAPRRPDFAKARDAAIEAWEESLIGLKVTLGKKGDIKVGFMPKLPPNADTPGPAGAVFFMSDHPGEPRVEALISLVRTDKRFAITGREVRNEVAYAIGAFLGLERLPRQGSAMDRMEGMYPMDLRVLPVNVSVARQALDVVSQLKEAARKRVRLVPAKPEVFVEPKVLGGKQAVQGDRVVFTFSLTNRGNSLLKYIIIQDCGCFAVESGNRLAPGATTIVRVTTDTTEFPGPFDKSVFVYSNDPDEPSIRIPVRFYVEPKYRFLRESAAPVELVPDTGLILHVYLAVSQSSSFAIRSARVDGVAGVVTYEPWEGTLADPEMQEPAKPRKGYKLSIMTSAEVPPGRIPMTLAVTTDDPVFSTIRTTIQLQKGIVALPPSVYFGQVGKAPSSATFLVSRPGKSFRIVRIDSDNPRLRATFEKARGDYEYRVTVQYDGKADFGDLNGVLKVVTDDPQQPSVVVPVSGVVR